MNGIEEKIKFKLNKMIEGCRNVKSDSDIHEDAKSLATAVIRDCYAILRTIDGEERDDE